MIFHFTQLCFLAVLVSAHQEKELDIPYDSSTSTRQNDEVCWERCFQVEDTEYERYILGFFLTNYNISREISMAFVYGQWGSSLLNQ